MHPHVFREVARLGEGLTTRVAAMGLLSRMRPHVSSEAASLGEGLAARVVAMGLRRFNATLPPIGVPFLVGGAGFEVRAAACPSLTGGTGDVVLIAGHSGGRH